MTQHTWTCKKSRGLGTVCGHVNPRIKQRCEVCGNRRPKTKPPPAHQAVMQQVTYEDLVAVMGERCWLCGKQREEGQIKLNRDHVHEDDGTMRGLLDWLCNTKLPKDVTPAWLRAAAEYMERGDWQHPDWQADPSPLLK